MAGIREAGERHARPLDLGRLEIGITPPGCDVPDQGTVDAYGAVDVDRLIRGCRSEMDAAAFESFAPERSRALVLTA